MKHAVVLAATTLISLLAGAAQGFSPVESLRTSSSASGSQAPQAASAAEPALPTGPAQPPDPIIVEYAGQIGGPTNAVALSGHLLALASGPSLLVLDVSDPYHPVEIGRLDLEQTVINDLAIEGSLGYVLTDRLNIVDLSDPVRPRAIGAFRDVPDGALHFDVSDGLAYLAGATMSIVDVSDPIHPALLGVYLESESVEAIEVQGAYAYVLSPFLYPTLDILDVSDPHHPFLLDSVGLNDRGMGISVEGDVVYASTYTSVCAVNLSLPVLPAHATCTPSDDRFRGGSLASIPGYVFAADKWGGLRTYRMNDPIHLALTGNAGVPGGAFDVALGETGSLAYVTNGEGGALYVMDIGNAGGAQWLSRVGIPPKPISLAVADNHVFVASEAAGLHIVDIANPLQPRVVGAFGEWSPITDVVIDANRAYITTGPGKAFGVLDITAPDHPTLMGSVLLPGDANGLSVLDDRAFVATGGFGLRVIDLSNSPQPAVMGGVDTPGNARAVTLSPDGRYAYIADWEAGLRVISIGDAGHPVEVGAYDTTGLASDVAVASRYAYIADQSSGLVILDIADPTRPTKIGEQATLGRAWSVDLIGSLAVIADGYAGATFVDVSNPDQPKIVASCAVTGEAWDAVAAAQVTAIADSAGRLHLCAVDESAPHIIGSFILPGSTAYLALSGDTAFATTTHVALSGIDSVSAIDVHDPVQLRQLGLFDKAGGEISLWGQNAYVLGGRLSILDAADPAQLKELMVIGVGGLSQSFAVAPLNQSLYAILSEEAPNRLRAIDVAVPAKPRTAASVPTFGFALAANGNHVYVGGRGLSIYDYADPAALRWVGYLSLWNRITDITVRGRYAYLADERYGLRIVDAADPAQPREAGTIDVAGSEGIALDESRAFLSGAVRLTVVDIRNPAEPRTLGAYEDRSMGRVNDVAASGNIVVLGTIDKGVIALRLLEDRVSAEITPAGGILATTDQQTTISFPVASFAEPMTVTMRLLLTDEHTGSRAGIGRTFEVMATQTDTGEPGPSVLAAPATLSVAYDDAELAAGSVDESTLAVFGWDGSRWLHEPSSALDPLTNRLTASPDHLGRFAVLGATYRYRFPDTRSDG